MQDFLAAIGLVQRMIPNQRFGKDHGKTKVLQRPLRVQRTRGAVGVEGLVYGGFPGLAKRLAGEVLSMPENALRIVGLAAIAIGVGIVWLVRG